MARRSVSASKRAATAGLVIVSLASVACLSGCELAPSTQFEALRALVARLLGQPQPDGGATPVAAASPGPAAAKRAELNAQLLHEIYQVVFVAEPRRRDEFGSLVNSLNQGASLEGIYNGFAHSSDYRKLEAGNPRTTPDALRAFGEELAILEAELPKPTRFSAADALPLVVLGPGSLAGPTAPAVANDAPPDSGPEQDPAADEDDSGVSEVSFGAPSGTPGARPSVKPAGKAPVAAAPAREPQWFAGASIFTLKRILGDEALKVIEAKHERPKLAAWYAKWVTHMSNRGIDFGLPQRNKADEGFHQQWAQTATEDLLKWEVLNRIHRLLNDAHQHR